MGLQNHVNFYVRQGWQIQSQSENLIQLASNPRASLFVTLFIMIAGFFLIGPFAIVLGLLYAFWPRKSRIVTLRVDEAGDIQTVKTKAR